MLAGLGFNVITSSNANAGLPVFLNPFKWSDNSYESKNPTIVQAKPQQKTTKPSYRNDTPVYEFDNLSNPLTNPKSGYLRIKNEMQLYDAVTGKKYNQYDYMGMLAARGDTAKLREIAQYVQQNGVFDPAKYKAAVAAAKSGSPPQGGARKITPSSRVTADGRKRAFKTNDQTDTGAPTRIHSGYNDEDTNAAPAANSYKKNQPIFLK